MESPSGLHHAAIRCVDLERCERFYREVLGLEVLRRWPAEGGGGDRSVWLRLGGAGGFLALERADGDAVVRSFDETPAGWYVVALQIARTNRGAWEERLASHGVAVARRSAWSVFFQDPEGNRIALTHWPEDA